MDQAGTFDVVASWLGLLFLRFHVNFLNLPILNFGSAKDFLQHPRPHPVAPAQRAPETSKSLENAGFVRVRGYSVVVYFGLPAFF